MTAAITDYFTNYSVTGFVSLFKPLYLQLQNEIVLLGYLNKMIVLL